LRAKCARTATGCRSAGRRLIFGDQ
jgi:hypothetical protein